MPLLVALADPQPPNLLFPNLFKGNNTLKARKGRLTTSFFRNYFFF